MPRESIFYRPDHGQKSGLPHDPFKSFVIPRPIGWISTKSRDGKDNLAPFSQFTNVSFDPPTILFVGHQSLYKRRSKDTVLNCVETNEFCWNMATFELKDAVNSSSLETWGDEFEEGKIEKAPSKIVRPPRVAKSPVTFECRVINILRIPNEFHGDGMFGPHLVGTSDIVIGRVLGIHVNGDYINDDGLLDVLKAAPIARNGYHQYTHITQVWDMPMPMMPDDTVSQGVLGGSLESDGQSERREVPGSVPEDIEKKETALKKIVSKGEAFAN